MHTSAKFKGRAQFLTLKVLEFYRGHSVCRSHDFLNPTDAMKFKGPTPSGIWRSNKTTTNRNRRKAFCLPKWRIFPLEIKVEGQTSDARAFFVTSYPENFSQFGTSGKHESTLSLAKT